MPIDNRNRSYAVQHVNRIPNERYSKLNTYTIKSNRFNTTAKYTNESIMKIIKESEFDNEEAITKFTNAGYSGHQQNRTTFPRPDTNRTLGNERRST